MVDKLSSKYERLSFKMIDTPKQALYKRCYAQAVELVANKHLDELNEILDELLRSHGFYARDKVGE